MDAFNGGVWEVSNHDGKQQRGESILLNLKECIQRTDARVFMLELESQLLANITGYIAASMEKANPFLAQRPS